jgi:heat shock protein HspQ
MILLDENQLGAGGPGGEPLYRTGELLRHRAYGYRGVVVSVDPRCKADLGWYLSNPTHPDRNQPWYHILVDGVQHTTYVAQENVEPDVSREPVHHPLLEHFFRGFEDGRYARNDRPWPP